MIKFFFPLAVFCVLAAPSWGSSNCVELQDLDLSKVSQSYASARKNSLVSGDPIVIAGEKWEKGIGTHAQSRIKVGLNGSSRRFSAKVGVGASEQDLKGSDISAVPLADGQRTYYRGTGEASRFLGVEGEQGKIDKGSVVFRVICDGKELFNSGVMTSGDKAKSVEVALPSGAVMLELIADETKDGPSGDAAVWGNPLVEYEGEQSPVILDPQTVQGSQIQKPEVQKRLMEKAIRLEESILPLARPSEDWLLKRDWARARVEKAREGKELVLTNGLVSRSFRISPQLATVAYDNLMTGASLLRAVSNEGLVKINGREYPLGGVDGQFEYAYTQQDWVDKFIPAKDSFVVEDFEISELTPRINWAKSRWAGNGSKAASGKVLTFTLRHPSSALAGIAVKIHYALYDGIPALSKWMEVTNDSPAEVTLNEFKLEQLAMVEPDSPVELEKGDSRFLKPNIHIESDWAFRGFTEREADVTEHWVEDSRYTSQCNYPLVTPCMLEVKLPMGPETGIPAGGTFSSFRVWEMPFDSDDRDRKGRFIKQLYRTISPWLTENPIFMHCTSSDDKVVKTAIDQCAEVGYEMVILSFGCGLNMEDESEANYARFKKLVDYGREKGVELGGYSLLSSRWVSDEVDVINPATGKRGGMIFGSSPCLSSEWGYDYFRKIRKFYEKTGMRVFENDGSYPGNVCASTKHSHHKGLQDSQWEQRKQIAGLYQWMCEQGIYTNIPDFGYVHNGGTKVGIGYREVNWSLPRERQLILGRQVNYDGMWERLPSMCWTFVPLTQYHGGGAAATLEPLSEHLKDYEAHMMQNYGAGIQACYRGHRLYDTPETRDCVKKVISWYKKYRDILNGDTIHLRRADGRDYDAFMHVNPDLEQKALLMVFNPLEQPITRQLEIPLYYTGLTGKAAIREQEGKARIYPLREGRKVLLDVTIPARGYTWFVVEQAGRK